MNPIYEKLKTQILQLPDDEQYDLYAGLRERFEHGIQDGSADVILDAEWEMEIESRVMDIANGRAELIPGDVAEREIDAVFARHGVARLKQTA
jgi:hypothetical protein